MTYAKGTDVSVDRSQQEITRILQRYQVDSYAFGASKTTVSLGFELNGVPVRIELPTPVRPDPAAKTKAANGRMVSLMPAWEQEIKETWRALALVLKANLELVERKAVSIEQAFMAFLVMPGESRVLGDVVLPRYQQALASNQRLQIEG